jgi:hypothetical protein
MTNALKWGLISSAAFLLWFCLEYLMGLHGRYIGFQAFTINWMYLPIAFLIVRGILERKGQSGGKISYRRSLAAGAGISLVLAALSPAVLWIFTTWINPDFFPALIRHGVAVGQFGDDGDAALQFNLRHYAMMAVLSAPTVGLIISSLAGLFIRSRM